MLEEIRVRLELDGGNGVVRRVGERKCESDGELISLVQDRLKAWEDQGMTTRILIDATPQVPWEEVVGVVDLCKTNRVTNIGFVAPLK